MPDITPKYKQQVEKVNHQMCRVTFSLEDEGNMNIRRIEGKKFCVCGGGQFPSWEAKENIFKASKEYSKMLIAAVSKCVGL